MAQHGHPTWYSWLVVVLVPVAASMAVLVVSLEVNARAVQGEREARLSSERALCEVVVVLDDAYRETPPATVAGRNVAKAVADLRVANRCG